MALSSTESEIIALCEGTTEAIWLRRLIADFDVVINSKNAVIYEDNQNCLRLVTGGNWSSRRSKHIDVKYRFISDVSIRDYFRYEFVDSEHQLADVFTKLKGKIVFERSRSLLGLY